MTKRFQKRVESFVCDNCNYFVEGTGYTNHCPECYWSKHVDINPGDRSSPCGGLMRPIGFETTSSDKIVVHKCENCGALKRNKTAANDNFEIMLALIADKFRKN